MCVTGLSKGEQPDVRDRVSGEEKLDVCDWVKWRREARCV